MQTGCLKRFSSRSRVNNLKHHSGKWAYLPGDNGLDSKMREQFHPPS